MYNITVNNSFSIDKATGRQISELVDDEYIITLRSPFTPDELIRLRDAVYQWGEGVPDKIEPDSAHHYSLFGVSSFQKTEHSYHVYNFGWDGLNNLTSLGEMLSNVFIPLKQLFLELNTEKIGSKSLKPQLIHYPTGGGFLGNHVHPYEPQKLGIILNLSNKGTDFNTGGNEFFTKRGKFSGCEEISGITIFRFDLLHGVLPIDREEPCFNWLPKLNLWQSDDKNIQSKIDYGNPEGRWVAVLSVQY